MNEFELTRFPVDPRDQLRAWDAADEYLLDELPEVSGEVVILADRWGALATALADVNPIQITDSFLTQQATLDNLRRNGRPAVRMLTTQDAPPERIDVLLVRVPKSLALLEDQLHRLAPAVHAGTLIMGTGMVTEIHTSTLQLFERILGPTRTSLAKRKARLIHCTPDLTIPRVPSPWPRSYALPDGTMIVNHAGIFCADRLDVGTRFFLDHLPKAHGRVLDLGCGNGVVGLRASLDDPEEVVFADESYQAIASARANCPQATFVTGDSTAGVTDVDLVLNNPPFHSHRGTTDRTAWRMFKDSRQALRRQGELYVIGNRHLGYHVKLRRLFGNCEVVASDPRFVILRAVKR
ncbi:methyltransferase [Nonomuraea soli]|uniref:16S rRNA (Guanine1207-N2)-methyltransferase n=1 Tax=Nonomuraea soli TaxID=1032476 RepID=A0A7W0CJ71_9ACTN|nr:methyltransferase [Nonomuraea soli]MBA2892140.1 16S rRNA (guanine1207-N2)-methyltransferase [Nonomuraea soli]